MVSLILAAALVAAPQKAVPPKADPDLRTFCTQGGVITEKDSKVGTGNTTLSFSNKGNRMIRLSTGHVMMVRNENGDDQLLVEEDGKYRRLVAGHSLIQSLSESPDGSKVAVIIVHKKEASLTTVPSAGLYLFDTKSWQGEQIVKLFGYTGIAWSPDSKTLAYGDYAKVRFFDVATGKVTDSCGVDSLTTEDGRERVESIGWLGSKALRLTYQNPRGKHEFVVTLP